MAIWLRPIFSDDTDIPLRRLLLADSLKTVFLSPTMHRHGTNQEFFTAKTGPALFGAGPVSRETIFYSIIGSDLTCESSQMDLDSELSASVL